MKLRSGLVLKPEAIKKRAIRKPTSPSIRAEQLQCLISYTDELEVILCEDKSGNCSSSFKHIRKSRRVQGVSGGQCVRDIQDRQNLVNLSGGNNRFIAFNQTNEISLYVYNVQVCQTTQTGIQINEGEAAATQSRPSDFWTKLANALKRWARLA